MEKFTVDLDAVLDEFEFHEEQAEQHKNTPSRGGIFESSDSVENVLSERQEVTERSQEERNGLHNGSEQAATSTHQPLGLDNKAEPTLDVAADGMENRHDEVEIGDHLNSDCSSQMTDAAEKEVESEVSQPDEKREEEPRDNVNAMTNGLEPGSTDVDLLGIDEPEDSDAQMGNLPESAVTMNEHVDVVISSAMASNEDEPEEEATTSVLDVDDYGVGENNTVNEEVSLPPSSLSDNCHTHSGSQPVSDDQQSVTEVTNPVLASPPPPEQNPAPTIDGDAAPKESDDLLACADLLEPLAPAQPACADDDVLQPLAPPNNAQSAKAKPFFSNDDYMDEKELEEYLRQLEMEKSEEKLLEDTLEGASGETDGAGAVMGNQQPDSVAVAELKPTGTRPKDSSYSTTTSESGSTEDVGGRPSLGHGGSIETDGEFQMDESELVPMIGKHSQSHKDERKEREPSSPESGESPPPYSELDPAVEPNKPLRPATLNLTSNVAEPDSETSDDTSVSAGTPVMGAPGETPSNPSGPRLGERQPLAGLSEEQLLLGRVQPYWIPDNESANCMICGVKFTVVKRRHHCRACGKVLCSTCCGDRFKLTYMENKEGRVCTPCKAVLERLDANSTEGGVQLEPAAPFRPNPANPMEYCSRVPVAQQVSNTNAAPPSVMVPVGVLKRNGYSTDSSGAMGSERGAGGAHGSRSGSSSENKSVIFSDGIRPGGDLTDLDGSGEHRPLGRRPNKNKSRRLMVGPNGGRGSRSSGGIKGDICTSKIPPTGLPMVSGKGEVEEEEIMVWLSAGTSVNFVLNNNLTVITKRVLYSPINKYVWNFASRGLTSVGQDEIAILLEIEEEECLPPRDIFVTIQSIYEQAGGGHPVNDMSHITVNSDYLGSNLYGGWLFIRHTFQTITELFLPAPPVLFGLLLLRPEMPWARVFPLRLLLRLGAESRYYPAPLVSSRGRKAVYGEIGHTIMNVLADFKNYTYALPTIRGLVIHMSPGRTSVLLPKNRHDDVSRALNNSNDPVLALGANFSISADSHLVAIQKPEGNYQTQAINILNKERKITGASFVVFNGALKSTANLTAKSSIVEDGIMVQVLPDDMSALRKSLLKMENREIGCGPVGAATPDEVISIQWVDEDKAFNIGIKSVIDGKPMDGIGSLRIHSGPEIASDSHIIRWTEVFLLKTPESLGASRAREPDPTRVAESVARAVGLALAPSLAKLKADGLSPLAVRVHLQQDNVSYEAGSNGAVLPAEYMNSLDNELVPLLHSAQSFQLVIELLFHILDQP